MQNNLMCDMFVLISEGKFKMYSSVEWIIPGQSWLIRRRSRKRKTVNSKIFLRQDFCLPKWRILVFTLNGVADQCNSSAEQVIWNSYAE